MTPKHELEQELLAAYVLHALDDGDARNAEQLLTSHVPTCRDCQLLLEGLFDVAGNLGLGVPPKATPRLLEKRLRLALRPAHRARWLPLVAGGVVVAVVATLGTWSATVNRRASQRQARTSDLLATVSHPESHVVPLSAEGAAQPSQIVGEIRLAAAFIPGRRAVYVFGSMPRPRSHRVYQVWVLQSGHFESAGTFVPEGGQVLVKIQADAGSIEGLLVTEEPGSGSNAPSDQHVVTASL
jgi:hypothetical protein